MNEDEILEEYYLKYELEMRDTYKFMSSSLIYTGRCQGKTVLSKHFINILNALSKQIAAPIKIETFIKTSLSRSLDGGFITTKVPEKYFVCPSCDTCIGNASFPKQPRHCEKCGQSLRYR